MERYRPSNGTEGAFFIEAWCCKCERDRNQDCPIVAATFVYDVDDPEYPSEWCYDETADPLAAEPKCTAFVQLGDPLPTPRCSNTPDLFPNPPTSEGDGDA